MSYSQRLTVTAKCKMNLRKFPHDSQSCPLKVASFGHSLTDVVYRWTEKPATLGDIELSQYHFISLDHGHENSSVRDDSRSTGSCKSNLESLFQQNCKIQASS